MKTNIINKTLALTAAAIALMGATTACVNDNSLCVEDQPGYEEGKDVWLTFNLKNVADAPGRISRTDDPSGHPEETSTAAENYINTSDISLMLLDDNGRLLKVFNPGDFTVMAFQPDDNGYRDYELTMHVNQDYFAYAGAQVDFRLMVVANMKGTSDADHGVFTDNLFMKTVPEIASQHLGYAYSGDLATNTPWTPVIADARHIPMAGIRSFSVSRSDLEKANSKDNQLYLTSKPGTSGATDAIEMQRAMAKIRVIDALKSATDNVDGEYIASVKLKGVSSRGSFVPDNAAWANGTCVLEEATWLTSWYQQENTVSLTAPEEYTDAETGKLRTRMIGYVPECGSEVFNETQSPTLEIVVANAAGATQNFSVKLSDLKEPGVTAFARNHIYQFIVEKNFQADITIAYTVCEWNSGNADIDFN